MSCPAEQYDHTHHVERRATHEHHEPLLMDSWRRENTDRYRSIPVTFKTAVISLQAKTSGPLIEAPTPLDRGIM